MLIRKAIGIEKGSGAPNTNKVGKISRKQLEEIAKTKTPDLTAADLEAAVRTDRGHRAQHGRRRGGPLTWPLRRKASEEAEGLGVEAAARQGLLR